MNSRAPWLALLAAMLFSTTSMAQIKAATKPRADETRVQSAPTKLQEPSRNAVCDTTEPLEGSAVRGGVMQAARLDDALAARARAGDAPAAWRAALASFRGECRSPNFGEMAAFMQIAHQAGHACASGAYGLMHARGWGVRRDLPQARELIERSIQAGCARAYFWGWLIDESAPNPRSRERALSSLGQGADRNDGHALNALAILSEIDERRDEARRLYLRAANTGNATARLNLARLAKYFAQSSEKPRLASLQERAQSGDAQAQFQLARRLHQGDGVSPNYVQALKWYSQSAAKGNAASLEMLQLIQSKLGSTTPVHTNVSINVAVMSDLAFVDLARDEFNKRRGISQPIEDTDPFAAL